MPTVAARPQLVDVARDALVDHVLCPLGGENVAIQGAAAEGRRAGGGGQIAEMPPLAGPPQLEDVSPGPDVDHVLGPLGLKYVPSERVGARGRGAGGGGEIIEVPGVVPPHLVDVVIVAKVEDVLGALRLRHICNERDPRREGGSGGGSEVGEVP